VQCSIKPRRTFRGAMPEPAETRIIVHIAGRLLTLALSGVFMSVGSPLAYGGCPPLNDARLVRQPTVVKTSNESNPYSRSMTNHSHWISIADDGSSVGSVPGTQADRHLPSSYRRKQRHYQFESDLERRGRPRPRWNEKTRSQRCQGGKQAATCHKTSAAIPQSQDLLMEFPHPSSFAALVLVERRLPVISRNDL
jgi:hypothetical protein